MAATGCDVDARLLSYAWGLEHAKQAAAAAAPADASSNRQQPVGHTRSEWLRLAVGWAAGAASCWLLLGGRR